jgi:hypothetical protein
MPRIVAGLAALLFLGPLGAAEPEPTPLLAKGFLQQIKPSVREILTFGFDGGKLSLGAKVPGFVKPVPAAPERLCHLEQIFTQAEVLSDSDNNDNDERNRNFTGTNLNGVLHTRRAALLLLRLEEVGGRGRTLEYAVDGKNGFRLQLTHPDGDMILLGQTPKGRFRCVAILGKRTFAGQGDSFVDFCKQHRVVMETDVLPILAHFGVEPILSSQDARVKKVVLARLTRTPDILEHAKKLLADLDSDQFSVREQATKILADGFTTYRDLVLEKMKDEKNSLEVKTRLKRIVFLNPDAARITHLVELFELGEDPTYLVMLLEGVSGGDATAVAKQLEKVSGQKLGTDAKAWKAWLQTRKK